VKKILDNMQRPCSVFVTFESEEGYERATRYNDWVNPQSNENVADVGGLTDYTHYEKILGEPIELGIQEASEPSDIIWENRQFTTKERKFKRMIVYMIILIMLCMSGAIIYVCTTRSTKLKTRYPMVDCKVIENEYGSLESEEWKKSAGKEFVY
jgi:hypothetical protein